MRRFFVLFLVGSTFKLCYTIPMGIILALIALGSWGIGDFLIQKSARKFGDLVALFYITTFAAIALFPFVLKDLKPVFLAQDGLPILLLSSFVLLFASLFDFEALRVGKISVVEPIYTFEVPLATALAAIFLNEYLRPVEYILIGSVLVGIFLIATRSRNTLKITLEKGVLYAIMATLCMGVVNFLFGFGARSTNPFLINWFASTFLAIITGVALAWQKRFHEVTAGWRNAKALIFSVSFFDNLAWLSFAGSMVFIPVGIATGISESYVALAAILGIAINHERLKKHQWVGLVLCVLSVMLLALITKK